MKVKTKHPTAKTGLAAPPQTVRGSTRTDFGRSRIAREETRETERKTEGNGCTNDIYYGPRTPTGRYRNRAPLREVVLETLRKHPEGLTKDEVYRQVLQSGYEFATEDPLNSLGVILYGRIPKFKRIGTRFANP